MAKIIKDFFKGAAFGATGIVPALSGGTVAMILGFYSELIDAMSNFNRNRRGYAKFLLPLLLGVLAGLILFSSAVHYMLTNFSFPTMTFFIGLIVGIIPLIYVKVKEAGYWLSLKETALVLVPMVILIIVSGLRPASAADPAEAISGIGAAFTLFIFFVGIVTGAVMVLPGISGAYILLLFGIYPLVTYSLSSIGQLLTNIVGVSLMYDVAKVLAPLVAGMLAGGFFMAKAIEKLLKTYYKAIHSVILGLLIGSVYALFKDPMTYQSGLSVPVVIIGAAVFVLGCVISFYLGEEKKTKKTAACGN